MLLAIDSGNTTIMCAVMDAKGVIHGKWRIQSKPAKTGDELAVLLSSMITLSGLDIRAIDKVVISTVVPQHIRPLTQLSKDYLGCKPVFVTDKLKLGLPIRVKNPSEVGADRLVNALAANRLYKKPVVIIDFGTATTFDVVAKDGGYEGGVIAPGIELSAQALHLAAAKLPDISLEPPQKVIGKHTVAAMQSGIFFGYLSMIEGLITRIHREMKAKPFVVATGGDADLFYKRCDLIDAIEPDLTLKGLFYISQIQSAHKRKKK